MKIQSLAFVAALGLLAVGCDQPTNKCQAARGNFAARYDIKSTTGDCVLNRGDTLGIQTYNPADPDDPNKQDLSKGSIAIKAFSAGLIDITASGYGVNDTDESHEIYSQGDFTAIDPSDGVCSVPSFPIQTQYTTTEEVPPITCGGAGGGGGAGGAGGAGEGGGGGAECVEDPGFPKYDIRYEWSNFQLLVRPDAPGTVWEADLKYTENAEIGGMPVSCTADIHAVGLFPSVDCGAHDADDNPTGEPDPSACLPEPDPDAGRVFGSGINPDFQSIVQCLEVSPEGTPNEARQWRCLLTGGIAEAQSALGAE